MKKNKKITKAVILCAGLGTRFLPLSKSVPKEMLPILNKPLIQILLEQLKDAGIVDALIITNKNKDIILNHFERNLEIEEKIKESPDYISTLNILNLFYKRQIIQKGTGDAVNLAKAFCENSPFLLCYGDEFFPDKNVYLDLINEFNKTNNSVISVQKIDKKDSQKYGIVKLIKDEDKMLVDDFVEKPLPDYAPSNYAYLGASILTKDIFEGLKNVKEYNGEIRLTDAFYDLIADKKLYAKIINSERFDIGNKLGFLKANIYAGLRDNSIKKELKQYLQQLL